ncbi:MAG TPA: NAD(P)-dependent oxidoreductase [Thermomicrobiales bacterium]|nr:NAD(P)-dependent oxidoreductase [Thermomicrobiales bacterium]
MADRMKLAIDLDGVLTEHPRPLALAASRRFGMEMPESAFVDSAGLNVPLDVRDWVYADDGPASRLAPAPEAPAFLATVVAALGADNVLILTARPEAAAAMTEAWLARHAFAPCPVVYADLKAAAALRHGVTHAVEDSLRHARNYVAAGVGCFVVNVADVPSDLLARGVFAAESLPSLAASIVATRAAESFRESTPMSSFASNGAANGRRPVIVISDAIHPLARARFQAEADVVDVDGTDRMALLNAVAAADALVVRSETQVTDEVLAAGPRLRVVARAGVIVLNAPGANAVSAAELTVALLLAVTRQIPAANASTHAGRWERKKMRPVDLRGRTVGIVGLGRVGSLVAQRLRAFEMKVLAYDPYITPQRFAEIGAAPVDYETLLVASDVVTFHVPATAETTHMLDRAALAQMKPTAIVINAARGEVVDQDALADALIAGRLAGAGVDVFPHEPCTSSPLFGLPNVVLTPHIGGSSAEALAAVGEVISASTLAALRGDAVPNAVNLPATSIHGFELQRLTTIAGAAGRLLSVLEPNRPGAFTVCVQGLIPPDLVEQALAAALAEALQRWTNDRVTPVNARLVAHEAGLAVRSAIDDPNPNAPATLTFGVGDECDDPSAHHVMVRWTRPDASIMEVDGFNLNSPLAGDVLITHHRDQPGMIGKIGTILGRYDVNIAGMQVGRHEPGRGGEAIMVLNVDDEIPAPALSEITAIPGIDTAYVVSLPEAPAPREASPSLVGAR